MLLKYWPAVVNAATANVVALIPQPGMAYYHTRTHILVQEPYELSQGPQSPISASPEELKAFYHDMEQKDLERKLSKRNSISASIWSRKSKSKPTVPVLPTSPPDHRSSRIPPSDADFRDDINPITEGKNEDQRSASRPIIPEPMSDLPSVNTKEWSAPPLPPHKVRYQIDNPHGPRWYRNYHLIPPSQIKPGMRPPSFFSTAFPPMGTSSTPEHMVEMGHPGPSRTPSHSPLPTPTSSDTRVAEGGRRSRKTSQTTPDNIDLLDVTDPWGTNWHHQSPYDWFGQTTGSVDTHDLSNNRPRRASMTAAPLHKSVAPSPLSQSTSAVHLHPSEPDDSRPRKLSKRRSPTVENVFSSEKGDLNRMMTSAPATPIERTLLSSDPSYGTSLPKRMSVAPSQGNANPTPKKEKRGSVLGRLARKFSILRKPSEDNDRAPDKVDGWHHISAEDVRASSNRQSFDTGRRQASPEKAQPEAPKRVPPPSVDYTVAHNVEGPAELDRSSSISLEAPFSMGKLTIANPDAPDYDQGLHQTLPDVNPPLPPEKPVERFHNGNGISNPDESPHVSPSQKQDSLALPPQSTQPDSQHTQSTQPVVSGHSRGYEPSVYSHASRGSSKANSQPKPRHGSLSTHTPTPFFEEVESNRASRASTHDMPVAPAVPEQTPHMQNHSRLSAVTPAQPPQLERSSPSNQVPFPTTQPNDFLPPNRVQSYIPYNDSPYSASSVLANPPTPYDDRTMISLTPEQLPPALPPKSRQETKPPTREPSPGQTKGRQTETFKLVRSSSGNVYASTERIVAAGQQWEVVESDGRNKPSSKSKEASTRAKESSSKTKESHSKSKESSPKTKESTSKTKVSSSKSKEPSSKPKDSSSKVKEPSSKPKESSSKPHESSSRSKESSLRPKDREKSSRREREHNRENSTRAEAVVEGDHRTRPRSHESSKHQHQDSLSPPVTQAEGRYTSRRSHNEHKSSQKRDGHRDRKSETKTSDVPAPSNYSIYAQPTSNGDVPTARPLERNPSTTTRPTSELPSAAEMNAMRATEAWEMERLWKARSMYAPELNGAMGASYSPAAPNSTSSTSGDATTQGAVYGSTHTAFVVQSPFQGQASRIYHSMPNAPPPVIYSPPGFGIYASPDPGIYSSPASIPSLRDSVYEPYERTQTHRSQVHSSASPLDHTVPPSLLQPTLHNNPLPEPPRESSYAPAPLSTLKSSGHSADYWTKYTGITTAH